MGKSPHALADRIEGAHQGFNAVFNSGRLTSVNGQVRYVFVAPFDGYVSGYDINIDTAFTNAAATAFMGSWADVNNDDLLNDFVVQNLTGAINPIGSALWVSKAVTKGQVYAIGFTNADTTGNGTITVTLTKGPGPLA